MSYCDTCIHHDVCGVEGVDDEAMTYCADKLDLCEEAISRHGVIDAMIKRFDGENAHDEFWNCDMVMGVLHDMPPVTPQPKIGHWIRWYEQKEHNSYIEHIPHCKCSECGKEYDPHSSQFIKYCYECGVKMQEVEE